jgi:hypothetical protein
MGRAGESVVEYLLLLLGFESSWADGEVNVVREGDMVSEVWHMGRKRREIGWFARENRSYGKGVPTTCLSLSLSNKQMPFSPKSHQIQPGFFSEATSNNHHIMSKSKSEARQCKKSHRNHHGF